MTKKEIKAFEDCQSRIQELEESIVAWKQTQPIEPDIPPPTGDGHTFGYHARALSILSYMSCHEMSSSKWSHYTGTYDVQNILEGKTSNLTGAQKPVSLYSKKSAALKNARYQFECECLKGMKYFDKQIKLAEEKEYKDK